MSEPHGQIGDPWASLGEWLAGAVRDWLSNATGFNGPEAAIEVEHIGRAVYRVRAATATGSQSVVVKQLDPDTARRNRLVAERWLPALGLENVAPRLLSTVKQQDTEPAWLMYEDVGTVTLKDYQSDRSYVAAAIEQIARLHVLASTHPCVGECRSEGGDLGMHFFETQVREAATLLEALQPPQVRTSREQADLRDRLRRRLDALLADAPRRAGLMADVGGPDTMLHADLWTTNVVVGDGDDERITLVDWDRTGAGPIYYDLSTFLYRFDRAARPWIVERYHQSVADQHWSTSTPSELNVLCDTAECARYASRIVWPAAALVESGATWGFAELRTIEGWFESLEPVLDA